MLRTSLLLALSVLPIGGETAVSNRPTLASADCVNAIPHELRLVYEVHGGTLAGPVDLNLLVYSDGAARIVNVSDSDAPLASVTQTDPEAVADLLLDLERMGGMLNCDAQGFVTDVPLHTLTLLNPGTTARAHTYSWWLPEGSNGAIEQRITQFVTEFFPTY